METERFCGSTGATRWLDDTEQAAWRAFIQTVGDLHNAIEADLAEFGLTMGDYQVLVFLSEADGHAMRMCDLATRLQLSPSGLTRRLDGLVRGSYVARVPSDVDRRVMLAVLTDAGMELLEKAAPSHVESVRRWVIDPLDRADIDALARIFTTIRAGLSETEPAVT